eukprot:m.76058 g.76058  ORF g.76058 m.76058 type:complete len:120 (+) comp10481_c0_seq2:1146-1505(+)
MRLWNYHSMCETSTYHLNRPMHGATHTIIRDLRVESDVVGWNRPYLGDAFYSCLVNDKLHFSFHCAAYARLQLLINPTSAPHHRDEESSHYNGCHNDHSDCETGQVPVGWASSKRRGGG